MTRKIHIKLMIILIILTGCSNNASISQKPIIYKPVGNELLKEVKPYKNKPEPTLKEKIELEKEKECLDKIVDHVKSSFINNP